jgi:hypothetical protein
MMAMDPSNFADGREFSFLQDENTCEGSNPAVNPVPICCNAFRRFKIEI